MASDGSGKAAKASARAGIKLLRLAFALGACLGSVPALAIAVEPQPSAPSERGLAPGAGQFLFSQWDGPALRVFYGIPDRVSASTPVLFVLHGVNRDADRYRDEWLGLADSRGMILVVPEFTDRDFPGTAGYNGGNLTDSEGRARSRSQWSFAAIELLFDAVRRRTGTRVASYAIFGHSAGGQFVHRFVTFMPEARYHRAIAANAGWYTMPDLSLRYPYGLAGTTIGERELRLTLGRPLTILLGTSDTDPNHRSLRRTRLAMAQGSHRLARGHSYFAAGNAAARRLGAPFGWTLQEVPGVAHENSRMAVAAASLLDQ